MSRWPDDREQRLRVLWAEGVSASLIGLELGISRNAVIGKVHRLKLPARKTVKKINSRPRVDARLITIKGTTLSAAEWGRRQGHNKDLIYKRLRAGWPEHLAVTKPSLRLRQCQRELRGE